MAPASLSICTKHPCMHSCSTRNEYCMNDVLYVLHVGLICIVWFICQSHALWSFHWLITTRGTFTWNVKCTFMIVVTVNDMRRFYPPHYTHINWLFVFSVQVILRSFVSDCLSRLICWHNQNWGNGKAASPLQDSEEVSDLDAPPPGPKRVEGENAPVYCICRKPDINCFMM